MIAPMRPVEFYRNPTPEKIPEGVSFSGGGLSPGPRAARNTVIVIIHSRCREGADNWRNQTEFQLLVDLLFESRVHDLWVCVWRRLLPSRTGLN